MKNTMYGLLIGALITIGLLLMLRGCENNPIESKVQYVYKTDTVEVKVPYKVTDTLERVTPPKIVIIYQDTGSYKTITVEKIDSMLLVRLHDLEDSVQIHEKFLKKFPKASKLLGLELNKDSLTLTTMDISSQVKSKKYPIDLDFYKYQYSDNTLRHDTITNQKENKPKSLIQQNLYGGASYSILQKAPLVHLQYPIKYRQIKFELESTVSIETTPKLALYLKALYKIK